MPVAVKTLPYSLRWQKGQFKKEYKAMQAVAAASHTVTVLSEDTGKVKGRSMKFIAMRYMVVPYSYKCPICITVLLAFCYRLS